MKISSQKESLKSTLLVLLTYTGSTIGRRCETSVAYTLVATVKIDTYSVCTHTSTFTFIVIWKFVLQRLNCASLIFSAILIHVCTNCRLL